jgi:PAS domain-containing protein
MYLMQRILDVMPEKFEWKLKQMNETSCYQVLLSPIKNERDEIKTIVGVSRDITDIRKSEKSLRKLNIAIEQNPLVIIITDNIGKIEYVNRQFELITGFGKEEVKGKISEYFKDDILKRDIFTMLEKGETWNGEIKSYSNTLEKQ